MSTGSRDGSEAAGRSTVPTIDDWRAKVELELGSTPFSRLIARTAEGIAIEPLAVDGPGEEQIGSPGAAPFVRGSSPRGTLDGWWIAQRVDDRDPAAANQALLADLAGGANATRLAPPAGVIAEQWLERALDGVLLEAIAVIFEPADDPRRWQAAYDALARARGLDPQDLAVIAGADPHRARVERGEDDPHPDALGELARRPGGAGYRAGVADGSRVHAAGATAADELGATLAAAAAQLRILEAAGLAPEQGAARIALRLAVGPEVFLGIAKLRAARRLWSLLLSACGIAAERQARPFLDVTTSPRTLSRASPWVNLLRATTETFAAVCGGADAIEVRPLDSRLGRPGALGRRLARNTQIVLAEEGGLGRVLDPAGGSYSIERLTDDLARAGWASLQAIEARGGYGAALEGGFLAERCEQAWQHERVALRTRRRALVGVSEFARVENTPVPGVGPEEEAPRPRGPAGNPRHASSPGLARSGVSGRESSGGLPVRALSADFEALRAAAESLPEPPTIYLATLGPLADHAARAGFVTSLAAAGGIAALDHGGTGELDPAASAAALAAGFEASGARLVCLCGADATYASHAVDAARALAARGPQRLLVAGRPPATSPTLEEELRAAGVDAFVALGDDAVSLLADLLGALGAAVPAEVAS